VRGRGIRGKRRGGEKREEEVTKMSDESPLPKPMPAKRVGVTDKVQIRPQSVIKIGGIREMKGGKEQRLVLRRTERNSMPEQRKNIFQSGGNRVPSGGKGGRGRQAGVDGSPESTS